MLLGSAMSRVGALRGFLRIVLVALVFEYDEDFGGKSGTR